MTKPKISIEAVLILLGIFLAPLLGGQVPATETQGLAPGGWLATVFGDVTLPYGMHLMIAIPFLIAGALILRRKVVQVPNSRFSLAALAFLAFVAASFLFTNWRAQTLAGIAEWVLGGIALFAVVAGIGRGRGPMALAVALFAGIVWMARAGILEFRQQTDPTWRIMTSWTPNSLGSLLMVGVLLGLGVTLAAKRPWGILGLLCVAGCAYALNLTGSKGSILSLGFGLGLAALLFALPKASLWLGRLGLAGALAVTVYAVFLTKAPSPHAPIVQQSTATQGGAVGRITNMAQSVEQSVEFRKLLFMSSVDLIKRNPLGSGIGTFQEYCAKPGLATPTVLAHNNLLQLGVEAGVLAPIALIVMLALWIEVAAKGLGDLPIGKRALAAGAIASVLALTTHGAFDSDLYSFGILIAYFVLLALGLSLAPDAVAPEIARAPVRISVGVVISLAFLQAGLSAYAESLRGSARYALDRGDLALARSSVESLKSVSGNDGRTWTLAAKTASNPQEQLEALTLAAQNQPLPRTFRTLSSAQLRQGLATKAADNLRKALDLDPNNPTALYDLMVVYLQLNDDQGFQETGARLLAVENTLYFQVRSIDYLVPTPTYEGRLLMASRTADVKDKIRLLQEAVDGFLEYRKKTFDAILRLSGGDPNGGLPGESLQQAIEKMTKASDAAKELAGLYRSSGDAAGVAKAEGAGADFAAALRAAGSSTK